MLDFGEMVALRDGLDGFLALFDDCFKSTPTRAHLRTYVAGQVSGLERKSVEPIALAQDERPRTLQQFLSLSNWDHGRVMSKLRAHVMRRHADENAVAVIDGTSFAKKGADTVGIKRQYCGETGKIDNCVVSVHLTYVAGNFRCLIDGDLFIPEDWAHDPKRRQDAQIPNEIPYRPKWQIALSQIKRALAEGMRFAAVTADEEFGHAGPFRRGLEELGLKYVLEVTGNTSVWTSQGDAARDKAARADKRLVESGDWKAFHVKDTEKGPVVWRARAMRVRVRGEDLKAGEECWLIGASNALEKDTKYFLSNAGPDATLEAMLRVAFSRAHIERCFEDAKGEVGMGHFEARRYKAVLRHLILSMVSLLYLTEHSERLREKKSLLEPVPGAADCGSAA